MSDALMAEVFSLHHRVKELERENAELRRDAERPEALRLAEYLESCDLPDSAAEVRRLFKENEEWQDRCLKYQTENAELRRDAERYRYIVVHCEVIGPDGHFIDDGEQLDAAMKEAK